MGRCLQSPSLSTQQIGIESQFVRTRLDSISHQKLGLCHVIEACERGSLPSSILPPAKPPVPVTDQLLSREGQARKRVRKDPARQRQVQGASGLGVAAAEVL